LFGLQSLLLLQTAKLNTLVSAPHSATIPKPTVSQIDVLRVAAKIASSTFDTDSEQRFGVVTLAKGFRTVPVIVLTVTPGQ